MAADGVRVRPVAPEDWPAVRALLQDLNDLQRDWRLFPPRAGFLDEVLDGYRRQVATGEAVHLVAEAGRQVVGTAFGREHVVSRFSEARALEVSSVVVRPESRGRGIGRRLLLALAEEAGRRGVGHLDLATFVQNDRAVRFWESAGLSPRYVQMVGDVGVVLRRLA